MVKYAKVSVTRSELASKILELIQQNVIDDISPAAIQEMRSADMFYLVLRHTSKHHEAVKTLLAHSEDFDNELAYYQRFDRLARFISHVTRYPPADEYSKYLSALSHSSVNNGQIMTTDKIGPALTAMRNNLHDYMHDLATIAIDKTETERSLQRYLRDSSKFYIPRSDPTFNRSIESNQKWKDCQSLTEWFYARMALGPSYATWHREMSLIFLSSTLYNRETYVMEDYAFPIVMNFIIGASTREFEGTASNTKLLFRRRVMESESNYDNDSRTANIFGDMVRDTHYFTPPTTRTVPSTPFPKEFFENKDELPNDPSSHTDKGKGKEKQHENKDTKSSGSEQSLNSSQQQQPPIPDDDNYVPDGIMSAEARDYTKAIRANPDLDLKHDHMSRFGTTTEGPGPISEATLQKGDWTILIRDRYGNRRYLVTYTRKSKKPIFSQIN